MKVAIVAAICVERDAISAAALSHARLAAESPDVERVDFFAEHIDRSLDVPGHAVSGAWELLTHPRFRDADLAVFHWGIQGPLFDAITMLSTSRPRPVLAFHNMTPKHLIEEYFFERMEASEAQLAHLLALDTPIWTFSEENRSVLLGAGVDPERIRFVPFSVSPPRPLVDRRAAHRICMLSIGRFSRAKGTDVLIEAMGILASSTERSLELEIVGNENLSDRDFMARLERRIDELGLADVVRMSTDVHDDGLWSRLERAHIVVCPSLHEGLSVPVIEAYVAGCRVVASDAGNLRHLVRPPDLVVPVGDAGALAEALRDVVEEVASGAAIVRPDADALCRLYSQELARAALGAALRELGAPATDASPWPAILAAPVQAPGS